jgi:hypothetical protein
MKIQYLEIVTKEVDTVCAAYASAHKVRFGEPDAGSAMREPLRWRAVGSWEYVPPCVKLRRRWCDPIG